jgi:hypothetical protein
LFLAGTTKLGVTQTLYVLLSALVVDTPPVFFIDCDHRPFRFSSEVLRQRGSEVEALPCRETAAVGFLFSAPDQENWVV